MKLKDALEGYWLEKRRILSKATIKDYTLTFRRLQESLGEDAEFEKITALHLRVFLEELKEGGLGPKSLLNVWTALSSLWTWAENELEIKHVMRGKVAKPKVPRAIIEPYSRGDVGLLLNACSKNAAWTTRTSQRTVANERPEKLRDRAIMLVLLDTGLRAQELCNLRAKHFDGQTGKLIVMHGKGDKHRIIYMGESARKALWRYLAARGTLQPDDVVLAARDGKPLDRTGLRKMIMRCAQRGGVERATVHRFRHTFAINFLRNGGSVLELQHMLGHARLDTIRIYATLAESDLREAQKRASPADRWNL